MGLGIGYRLLGIIDVGVFMYDLISLFGLEGWDRMLRDEKENEIYLFVDRAKFMANYGSRQGCILGDTNREDVDGGGMRWDAHFSWDRLLGCGGQQRVPYALGTIETMERIYDVWVKVLAHSGLKVDDPFFDQSDHNLIRVNVKKTSTYGPVPIRDLPLFINDNLTDGFRKLLKFEEVIHG